MRIKSLINAVLQSSKTQFTKKNPFNSENLHEVESCDLMQAVQAIQGAQKAFAIWKASSHEDRFSLLNKLKTSLLERIEIYAQLEATDQGLPLSFVLEHSLKASIASLEQAISQLENNPVTPAISYSATGVISLISSWNLSLRIIFERLAPALAAGNAVIIKVSSSSPVTAHILSEIILSSEIPAGLIQVVVTNDTDVRELLISHPGIKAVSFVGHLKNASTVLKKISSLSFNQFKKVQIATGSKNTAIALTPPDDQNFHQIMNSFLIGQGQLSWNSNRFFILEKFEELWHEKIENFLTELKPAESILDSSLWGPCIRNESFTHFSEIESLARTDQAKLIQAKASLSDLQKNCYLRPTFTKDMSNCSTLQQDQVMAPLFILSVVKYPFDIAKYSNVSYYGQSAHIWGDETKMDKIADELEVAQIFKNSWSALSHYPNKGVKQSGFGLQDYQVFGDFFSNVKKMT